MRVKEEQIILIPTYYHLWTYSMKIYNILHCTYNYFIELINFCILFVLLFKKLPLPNTSFSFIRMNSKRKQQKTDDT